jgi:CrcB protein
MLHPRSGGALKTFLLICAGGAAGTGARYLVATGMARWLGPAFPAGTLTVNVVGSLLVGAIMDLALRYEVVGPELRLVLVAGVMGGFTTYSSFNHETLGYFARGSWGLGIAYLAATVVGCLAAGMLGIAAARWLAA